ncbi:protein TonB [Novosphingobium chloroacetimidivorans]|uniref:Protein TonB n=1 Tax=Novosphingobium chloroacetimidivorans TaxID=1428314 RepID=A0A7W7NVX8_9SPHN|nr:energy transducer TonB [Novosphingobium chloroacetimidivorans]MBB4857809.1 protein TonB [Novosphingobium chloroacetimidivorans]
MAYADQSMSGNKVTAIVIVALIHIFIGYALVTGLAYEAYKKAVQKVTTVDIKEEEPKKEEEPPPPPEKKVEAPPPPVAPPVKINVATTPPQIQTVTVAPPPAPPVVLAGPPIVAPPAPPAPPAPTGPTSAAQPRGNPASWATPDDYPQRALREEKTGTTGFRVTVGTDGRVVDCTVTSSSGTPELDDATCKNVTRRARFKPALQNGQPVQSSYSNRIRWVIPE